MLLLMVGNGLQGTLLGVRGAIEGFSTFEISIVMSAYFLGFLGGSRAAPDLIRRVGHIRVFAALASTISAVLILYPALANPIAWTIFRVIIGFCFSAVYVTAESWLNNASTNQNRGKTLSVYMIVQMSGIVMAQGLLVMGDPSGYILFVVLSVLVSISFAPILLSVTPTPSFETTKPMGLKEIYSVSPLGCVGIFLMGGVYSAQFGMASVYGIEANLSLGEISLFVSSIYIGGMLLQYPIGWISDRMDRRLLILMVAAAGGAAAIVAAIGGTTFWVLLTTGFLIGGTSNPLYALLMAYTNDFLEHDQMAAAGGRLIFLNGLGAIAGPLLVGGIMTTFGAPGFFIFMGALMIGVAGYAAFRMTVRPAPSKNETGSYAPVLPSSSSVTLEIAQELFSDSTNDETTELQKPSAT
ncbi:MAG: MFS family permease [Paracoccaceae bacterium]|jgi:MFS family permease